MQTMPYADRKLVENYVGIKLSEEDKRRVADAIVPIPEMISRPDLLIYSTGQALSVFVTSVFQVMEELLGEEAATKVAREMGLRHGELNYGRFLRNRGLQGGPRSFAEYQDWGHGCRGPRHAVALFAEYDDEKVVVKRSDCLYFWGNRGEPNKYVEILEKGIQDGYKRVDPSFSHVENPRCLCKGTAEGCEHRFMFTQ